MTVVGRHGSEPHWVVLAGGVGGARFTLGVRELAREVGARVTVIVNTGDDVWLAGARVCPDLDSITYALAGVNDTDRGWGRAGDSDRVAGELSSYGVGWSWFTLGDLDLGTCLARAAMLADGLTLTAATARIVDRFGGVAALGVTVLPVTDAAVETHVDVVEDGEERLIHFEEWWVRTRAALPARRFVQVGLEDARVTPAAAAAIGDADVVFVAPSNPVVSIGTLLGIPGVRDALATTAAPIVGVSPIIGGRAVRGMADACLTAIGVATDAGAVARHYGARADGGLLDAWLVADEDADAVATVAAAGIRAAAAPLWMTDPATTARMARAALALVD